MSKVRVYELAKEYGLKGPDLAKMLKELGFDAVKSHMAVLDDATELQVRAIIETQGLSQQAAPHAAEPEAPPSESLGPKKKPLPAAGGHGAQGHGASSHGTSSHGAGSHVQKVQANAGERRRQSLARFGVDWGSVAG